MPVLTLDGGAPGLAFESMQRVAENLEGGGIGGARHFLQEEQPYKVADRLTAFLD